MTNPGFGCDLAKDTSRIFELEQRCAAPRIQALEGLLHTAQHEAHAGREAIATLASERAANAVLTDEVERLQSAAAEVIAAFEALGTARGATENVLARQRCEKSMVALEAAVFRHNAEVTGNAQR